VESTGDCKGASSHVNIIYPGKTCDDKLGGLIPRGGNIIYYLR
jgi:hypothetical protein